MADKEVSGTRYINGLPERYWELEAVWWEMQARRHGSSYRASLKLPWWRKILWEFKPLPKVEAVGTPETRGRTRSKD